ncbi:fumarylacetoacetate hydrolase family protein [Novosphingobium taihuense]|uniref:2-keto-4-pentenoate hydratase/2-oxohepta-3-ene-1,7-dioic acid hydratase in catechol pathway n=1 Tax=Novosphingobium taihuense TaxID=260085 RepID=A0A7W7EUF6_9SPHN|nr:fumarylacetoacetate hydrolase family protein [Novosphingobium taihuense]MBB4612275.1 2-keto-4-pentenoate hydratase/2-oxohepta-3-ene-1,7-dioic acid hydratase in catechol pathway [Novosphingobium taihuense]TWH88371.1 2-keto-4-pentenoate hydratase/2-oxohepta-3-ene-1,7-dioic acid hydratase in catechol pathway [Novosphingobium taihuense]
MKLMTFALEGRTRLGAVADDGGIVDLAAHTEQPAFGSMQSLIEAGDEALRLARSTVAGATITLDPAGVVWLSPLPQPVQMRDFLVFEEHMRVAGWRGAQLRHLWGAPPAPPEPMPIPDIWYQQPIYYKCNRFAVTGTGGTIMWPRTSKVIDYELEIACVIGKGGRDIDAADAAQHIFGYTIFNDLTARDLQFREMQGPLGPAKGKDFDGANVLGPVIVTRDELGDAPDLAMRALVNGEVWSEGRSGSMHWSWGQIIEYVSRSETLHPGEVLGSGTVGTGCGLELGRMLCDGDVVRLEIEGIGAIETTICAPHVTERTRL